MTVKTTVVTPAPTTDAAKPTVAGFQYGDTSLISSATITLSTMATPTCGRCAPNVLKAASRGAGHGRPPASTQSARAVPPRRTAHSRKAPSGSPNHATDAKPAPA